MTEELQLLEKEYTVVGMTSLASLTHSKLPTSHLRQHILHLPQQHSVRDKYKKLLERYSRSPANSSASLEQLFLSFSPYCDFLNPDLLEHLVGSFGDQVSQAIISAYLTRLRQFRKRTSLRSILGKWVGLTPPEYVEVRLEMGVAWGRRTLEDLEVFRSHPTRVQWFLKRVGEGGEGGGMEVAFSVPRGAWLYQEDLGSLRKSGVLAVSEGGRMLVELGPHTLNTDTVSITIAMWIDYLHQQVP